MPGSTQACSAASAGRELTRLCETPRHPGVIRLQSDVEIYRVRIGDLHLLFSVEDQILLVLIVKIGHRGSVYRAGSSPHLVVHPMGTDANRIVQKLWSYCTVLRDDGLSYGDSLEQLSVLLFFKLARDKLILDLFWLKDESPPRSPTTCGVPWSRWRQSWGTLTPASCIRSGQCRRRRDARFRPCDSHRFRRPGRPGHQQASPLPGQ